MSAKTLAILEQIKTLTLVEVVELVQQIEDTFGVDASSLKLLYKKQPTLEYSTSIAKIKKYDVILEKVPINTRVAIINAVWNLTDSGLKEARKLVNSAPILLKQSVSSQEAFHAKKQLESFGAIVSLK